MQIHVYGDIGGWFDPFMRSLERIGVNVETGEIPADTIIVQVGDLIHRGPDSDKLVAWVDHAMRMNNAESKRWIQLFGNHEGHHIGGPMFSQNVGGKTVEWELGKEEEKTLKAWWGSRRALMACAVRRTDTPEPRDVLITHAGLTRQTWLGIDETPDARTTAMALNNQSIRISFAPGWLLGGYIKSREGSLQPPSVAWASAAKEVYPSWELFECPFDQIHGHSTIWNWSNKSWYVDYSIGGRTERDAERRFTKFVSEPGDRFYCIDQALGQYEPHFKIEPFSMTGDVLSP